jgi:hypothetical protein
VQAAARLPELNPHPTRPARSGFGATGRSVFADLNALRQAVILFISDTLRKTTKPNRKTEDKEIVTFCIFTRSVNPFRRGQLDVRFVP